MVGMATRETYLAGWINNIAALVQIMTWRQSGEKTIIWTNAS